MACQALWKERRSREALAASIYFQKATDTHLPWLFEAILTRQGRFTIKDHIGPLHPEYYVEGVPGPWKCVFCLLVSHGSPE